MRYNNTNAILPKQTIHITIDNFYLQALASSTIGLKSISSKWQIFQYSRDRYSWYDFNTSTELSLNNGDIVYFRAKQNGNSTEEDLTQFKLTGNIKAAGNIMWLYDYENSQNTTITYEYALHQIFAECDALTDIKDVILPATTLSRSCYQNLFMSTKVSSTPVLPAPVLKEYCYQGIYAFVDTLTDVTMLATDISASNCLLWWLIGTPDTSSQILYKNANTPRSAFNVGDSGIPYNWTVIDV